MVAKEGGRPGRGAQSPMSSSFCISKIGTTLPRRVVPTSPGSAQRRKTATGLHVCVRSPRTGNLCRLISLILLIKTIYEPAWPLGSALFFLLLESESGGMWVLRTQITHERAGKGRLACLLTVVVAPSVSR